MRQKIFCKLNFFLILFISVSHIYVSAQKREVFKHVLDWENTPPPLENLVLKSNSLSLDGSFSNVYHQSFPHAQGKVLSFELVIEKTERVEANQSLLQSIKNNNFEHKVDLLEIKGQHTLHISAIPYKKTSDGKIERLLSFSTIIVFEELDRSSLRNPESTFTSVLSTGDIYKVSVNKTGVFKMDKSFFESKLGIDISKINPKNIKIFGNRGGRLPELNKVDRIDDLKQLKIFVAGEEDGKFDNGDFVLFYAEGADLWKYENTNNAFNLDKNIYENNNYYFIKIDNEIGLRIESAPIINENPEIITDKYDKLQRFEDDVINLLGSYAGAEGTGKEWYGEIFNNSSREKNLTNKFDFTGLDIANPIEVSAVFAGRSRNNSSVIFSFNDQNINRTISSVNVTNQESTYAKKIVIREKVVLKENNVNIKINYPASSAESEGWLDYLQIISKHKLSLTNDQITFRNRETLPFTVAAFKIENISNQSIWDVTDPFAPVVMPVGGNQFVFYANNALHEFISHSSNNVVEPIALGKIPNQNIHAMNDEEMIIVYHPLFKSEALRFKEHRQQKSGFKVLAVETTQIYNEFSGGKLDPGAIRDMAKLLLSRNSAFKYLLLMGDGSYDYKGLVKDLPLENFVPVYETDESLDPIDGFPSDDFYGLLGPEEGVNLAGGLDIYVGRLPAKNVDEANTMVNKIIHYENSDQRFGDWRIKASYVADDEDGNTHLRDMEDIARLDEVRHSLYNQQKVYIDAFKQVSTPGENRYPDVNKLINDQMFKGQVTMTYLGHGGPLGWAQERILTVPEIQNWTNYNNMSVIITATCSFGAYDDPAVVSPAEYAILNPKGGAIALFTTTRAVFTTSNKQLTEATHNLLYKKTNGRAPTLGYALTEGKNRYTVSFFVTNARKFSLLGDPSLEIALPKYDIVTTEVNGFDPNITIDTISALEKVTIKGFIKDENGNIATNFNGIIYPTVYDKKSNLQTLANDSGSSRFNFSVYKNIIFKGTASVKNGLWSYSFWVPKTINYSFGNGRISYYATDNQNVDAGGVFDKIIIGGTSKNFTIDDEIPKLDVYINDESFVSGGITNSKPILLLNLEDDLGINVTGNAIGQDITAVLDGDDKNVFILNDFYEAKQDDYTKGSVRFPLNQLENGSHFITAKAWDISGNSVEKRIDFIVSNTNESGLSRVYNYPNPFTSNTHFQFEHNLSDTELDIVVNIFTITGKLIKTIQQSKYYSGFRVNDVEWNGKDDYDNIIARGVYIYKISIHSKQLKQTRESGFEKLIKL